MVNLETVKRLASYGNGLYGNAIINGNFDIWQRNSSGTPVHGTPLFTADRWEDYPDNNGGTLPTLSRSVQSLTAGDIPDSFYYSRLTFNGAGSSLGTASYHRYSQKIEHGTRFLCGSGKKVSISFWARSDVSNKKIAIGATQNYGTGGSPSTAEYIVGENVTLSTSWEKYTVTLTTNTLSGKTFGTNNNDYLRFHFLYMWGSSNPFGATGSETYVGSGYVDIAQVQLNAGSEALPFCPRSYGEELALCYRYFQNLNYFNTTSSYRASYGVGQSISSTTVYVHIGYLQPMRTTPTLSFNNLAIRNGSGSRITCTGLSLDGGGFSESGVLCVGTVSSGLTAGQATHLCGANASGNYIHFDAEL